MGAGNKSDKICKLEAIFKTFHPSKFTPSEIFLNPITDTGYFKRTHHFVPLAMIQSSVFIDKEKEVHCNLA